jgi:hypothetical protein
MASNGPYPRGPVPLERPSSFAELEIQVGPAIPLGTAKGRVPPDQANYFIMTFGILGSVVTGTAGAVLTLRIAPRLTGVALAELILALAAVLVIAACQLGRERSGRAKSRRRERAQADSTKEGKHRQLTTDPAVSRFGIPLSGLADGRTCARPSNATTQVTRCHGKVWVATAHACEANAGQVSRRSQTSQELDPLRLACLLVPDDDGTAGVYLRLDELVK